MRGEILPLIVYNVNKGQVKMIEINYKQAFIRGITFALIILGLKLCFGWTPAHAAELSTRQENQKIKAQYYLKEHFYTALKPKHGVDAARKYAFYAVEEFNNELDRGVSIRKAKSRAMVRTYKAINGEMSDYDARVADYKKQHKAKYYMKRSVFWPLPIPNTMIPRTSSAPTPVMVMPTGVPNTGLMHPMNDPFASPTPVIFVNN